MIHCYDLRNIDLTDFPEFTGLDTESSAREREDKKTRRKSGGGERERERRILEIKLVTKI